MTKKLYDHSNGDELDIFLLIKKAVEKTTKNNKPFLALTFQDTSGEMGGNLWDSTPEQAEQFVAGEVVYIKGKREEYNGNPQIRINSMRLAQEGEPKNKELYVKRAPLKKDEMVERFNDAIFEIQNPVHNRIVRFILNKYHKSFFEYPAASKNHHAFHGGLAFHTVTMLELAQSIADIYPSIDKSLLFSGLILHDIGKVIELTGPTATEYTLEGKLVGHIVIIYQEIVDAAKELSIDENDEDLLILKHIVLAHHGKQEYGSPVVPKIKEAEVLHMIDNMDARINMMDQALEKTEPGEFSSRVWALDNRSFYKPNESYPISQDEF